jgi:hypothetical protein
MYEDNRVYFLPILQNRGLILRHAQYQSKNYRRVGYCYHDWACDEAAFISAFKAADNQAKDVDFSEVKVDGNGMVHRFIDMV